MLVENGGVVEAVIPAYLYESCCRLDYYRGFGRFNEPLVLSHALVGWQGFPVARTQAGLSAALRALEASCCESSAALMFAGIDGTEKGLLTRLRADGYAISRFHTTAVRDLRAAGAADSTTSLPKRKRDRIRNQVSRARRAGTHVRAATPADFDVIIGLLRLVLKQIDSPPDLLPKRFLEAILSGVDGLDLLVACGADGEVVGTQVNLASHDRYFTWLAGHDRNLLPVYHQSHALYVRGADRALAKGCGWLDAGRDPYPIKQQHGYVLQPLYAASKGSTPEQHRAVTRWVRTLAARHVRKHGQGADSGDLLDRLAHEEVEE